MNKIFVAKPYLPDFKEYSALIEKTWNSAYLTNNGPYAQKLEELIEEKTGVKNSFVSNGTVAISLALKALDISKTDKILTTPFTFIATSSVLEWEGYDFDFVDIDQRTLNVSTDGIEEKLSSGDYKVLLLTHVFGNPCDVVEIEKMSAKYDVKVIYDAAHCFNVKINKKSLFSYGDISTCSYHSTKVFTSIEGGGIFSENSDMIERVNSLRNFGLVNSKIKEVGINAKNSEFHAAMGLIQIELLDEIIEKRQKVYNLYLSRLEGHVEFQKLHENLEYNFIYMPILLNSETQVESVTKKLESNNIYPRRYFYPSLDTINIFKDKLHCANSRSIAERILCLPIYPDLSLDDVEKISSLVLEAM